MFLHNVQRTGQFTQLCCRGSSTKVFYVTKIELISIHIIVSRYFKKNVRNGSNVSSNFIFLILAEL